MGTAQIETRGNKVLELAEQLRQRRKLRFSTPEGCQMVPEQILDNTITTLVILGRLAGELTDADVARFNEAWFDQ